MMIALFVGQIHLDTQRKAILGIYDKCREAGIDLHLYTFYSTRESEYGVGEIEYINRINFDKYAGFIVYVETLYDLTLRTTLVNKLIQYNKPMVSIDYLFDNCTNILTTNDTAMKVIAEHLVNDHHARKFNIISGPVGSVDSNCRKRAFLSTLDKYGLSVSDDRIYIGDYYTTSGTNAISYFEENGLLDADAYVCINDQMALGAMYALKNRNINVPRDCLVTGYDNILQAQYNIPTLTSVERHEYHVGELAFDGLMDLINGGKKQIVKVDSEVCFRGSCCDDIDEDIDLSSIVDYYTTKSIAARKYADVIDQTASAFITAKDVSNLCEKLPIFLKEFSINDFYLCLDYNKYSDQIFVPFGYRNGIGNELKLNRNDIIPNIGNEENCGSLYIFTSLHYLDKYFGYAVVKDILSPLYDCFYHMFINNIDNALEAIHNLGKMTEMIDMLERTSSCDLLTKLNNRYGFFNGADKVIKEAKKNHQDLYVLFADLDGLKAVNDKLGHGCGDKFICDFADILKATCSDELIMRFGGDEFVILGRLISKTSAEDKIKQIQDAMDKLNNSDSEYAPYKLSASIGICEVNHQSNVSLLSIIDEADKNMYIQKCNKREK